MTENEEKLISQFLKLVKGRFNCSEELIRYSTIAPSINSYHYVPREMSISHERTSIERTVVPAINVTIPIDKIVDVIEILFKKTHPTDNDLELITLKEKLYYTDSYFRDLYDQLNTYLFMMKN